MISSSQPFILIVDDNPTNLSVLSKALKLANYKVRAVVDGEEALKQVELHPPELILLDIQMPKLDGFETCRRLQANPVTSKIPVIFMTALGDADNKVKGLSLGAVDYITKPFDQEEVLARVKVHWKLKQLTDLLEQQVTEQSQTLQKNQTQLLQQEKFSTLGHLIAGIGHEINNPLGCITSNIEVAKQYLADMTALLALYQEKYPQPGDVILSMIDEIDLDFISQDFVKLQDAMAVAGNRLKDISESLRNFARADDEQKKTIDLHEGLENTLLLLQHRIRARSDRPAIDISKHYGGLPLVECYPGLVNQVFMNILANAIDALEESNQGRSFSEIQLQPNQIKICTEAKNDFVVISISDNGVGMSEPVKERIFEYQFTTKGIGKGTGLGLAIAHQAIVEKHGGKIEIASEVGHGTTFTLVLPQSICTLAT
jgi:signal transduction histidine kinase